MSKTESTDPAKRPSVADGANILLIDDDPLVCQTLSYALAQDGFQTYSAVNRHEAVSHLKSRHIHILLMDLNPRFENAHETFDCLVALQPDLRVIAMTSKMEREVESIGPSRYRALFEKPLDLPGLVAAIRNVID
jgi:DNA-binding NtrC family response regulator